MEKTKTIIFLLFGFIMLNNSCSTDEDLKSIAESFRVENDVAGMGVAVVKADTILEMFTLGVRRNGHHEKIQLTDRFHIGSNTKAMTSFVAGHLVEKEKIEWSTSFIELYPEWKTMIDSQYWEITLGSLLSHRAKIQAFWTDVEFDSIEIPKQPKSIQRRAFNKYALNRNPITPDTLGFHYSNAGYSIAGQMLEQASGQTWEALMKKVFNDDLNLDIGFSWPNKTDPHQPWGHRFENGNLIPCPPEDDYNLDWLEPGGDVNISLPNYCKFIQLNLKGLSGIDNYLKSETYHLLQNDRNGTMYAYGWGNDEKDGRSYSFHAGSAGTFFAHTVIEKTEPIAYIIMLNSDSPNAREMVLDLRAKMEIMYANFVSANEN